MLVWELSTDVCNKCGQQTLNFRIKEDSDCHEDVEYNCTNCGNHYWIDGCDY